MIPDIPECFRIMVEYEMLPNIRCHSIVVAQVAWQLVEGIKGSRIDPTFVPDQTLVVAGALLHDIAKTPCLQSGGDHARAGAEICDRLGYPEIAGIVEEHVILRDYDATRCLQGIFSAREIIYYADKRVRHEEIVSLDDRLDYILEHYGAGDPDIRRRIKENFAKCVQLEQCLFTFLLFSPEQLAELVCKHKEGAPIGLFCGENTAQCVQREKGGSHPGIRGYGL